MGQGGQLTIKCMTWNLHGKGIEHVPTMLAGLQTPADVMFLQELGDVRGLALGTHREDFVVAAGREFVVYITNPELSHRCSAILVACEFEFKLHELQVHGIGLSARGEMLGRNVLLAGLHFPHAHRPDALEVWRSSLSSLQESLDRCMVDTTVLVGHDLNQDVHAQVDSFEGMMHYRQFLARTGVEISPPQGPTWIARGSESSIDFFLFRIPSSEVSFWIREDFRIALPSDQNAVGITVQLASGRSPLKRWLVHEMRSGGICNIRTSGTNRPICDRGCCTAAGGVVQASLLEVHGLARNQGPHRKKKGCQRYRPADGAYAGDPHE